MLIVTDLVKRYSLEHADVLAVDNVTFEVKSGEFFTLLGPSGCGKSTTLRCVAGLEHPDAGRIEVGGRALFDSATNTLLPAHVRDSAMVFQSYAVWPHMTVFENVAFPLRVQRKSKGHIHEQTMRALDMVGLSDTHSRSATLLSGGQQQRVALARAIVKDAKVLLLDEPLSNLDAELRLAMRRELRDLQQRLGITTLYVTHDQDEALSLSDRIALMRNGRIVELGTPEDLYLKPRDPFTARFIGQVDLVPSRIVGREGDQVVLETPFGVPIHAMQIADASPDLVDVALLIRPEHVDIQPQDSSVAGSVTDNNLLTGEITETQFSGKLQEYTVSVNGSPLRVQSLSRRIFHVGQRVDLALPRERCIVVPRAEVELTAEELENVMPTPV